jgi:transcription elongation factor Elf1
VQTISNSKYLEHSSVCPRCGGCDFEGDSIQVDNNIAWQSIMCNECGLSWVDEYTLTGISNVYDDDIGDIAVVE